MNCLLISFAFLFLSVTLFYFYALLDFQLFFYFFLLFFIPPFKRLHLFWAFLGEKRGDAVTLTKIKTF
ncbi:hypothetical protein FDC51_15770 [Clostridium botulinum]|nr:hypothetical protein [Clostridium botulinum]